MFKIERKHLESQSSRTKVRGVGIKWEKASRQLRRLLRKLGIIDPDAVYLEEKEYLEKLLKELK